MVLLQSHEISWFVMSQYSVLLNLVYPFEFREETENFLGIFSRKIFDIENLAIRKSLQILKVHAGPLEVLHE